MSTETDYALYAYIRDQRNQAWSALHQIKKAMPYLADLLDVLPAPKEAEVSIVGDDVTGEATWNITGMSPHTIQLSALIGATLDVIAGSGLPEDYTDEGYTDPISPVPDTGKVS